MIDALDQWHEESLNARWSAIVVDRRCWSTRKREVDGRGERGLTERTDLADERRKASRAAGSLQREKEENDDE